jgi:hypothetical protein
VRTPAKEKELTIKYLRCFRMMSGEDTSQGKGVKMMDKRSTLLNNMHKNKALIILEFNFKELQIVHLQVLEK